MIAGMGLEGPHLILSRAEAPAIKICLLRDPLELEVVVEEEASLHRIPLEGSPLFRVAAFLYDNFGYSFTLPAAYRHAPPAELPWPDVPTAVETLALRIPAAPGA